MNSQQRMDSIPPSSPSYRRVLRAIPCNSPPATTPRKHEFIRTARNPSPQPLCSTPSTSHQLPHSVNSQLSEQPVQASPRTPSVIVKARARKQRALCGWAHKRVSHLARLQFEASILIRASHLSDTTASQLKLTAVQAELELCAVKVLQRWWRRISQASNNASLRYSSTHRRDRVLAHSRSQTVACSPLVDQRDGHGDESACKEIEAKMLATERAVSELELSLSQLPNKSYTAGAHQPKLNLSSILSRAAARAEQSCTSPSTCQYYGSRTPGTLDLHHKLVAKHDSLQHELSKSTALSPIASSVPVIRPHVKKDASLHGCDESSECVVS